MSRDVQGFRGFQDVSGARVRTEKGGSFGIFGGL